MLHVLHLSYATGDCYDPDDTGSCDDAVTRWYFDHNKGDCKAFYYSGCGGNGNNFLHYEDCVAFCSRSMFDTDMTIMMIEDDQCIK